MIIKVKTPVFFDLDKTLDCGQCFRWSKTGNSWSGVVNGYQAKVQQKSDFLEIDSDLSDELFWIKYFDFDSDYEKMIENFYDFNPILNQATFENKGIRILNQDYWETLCSFIISQNNNIPRIKGIISNLCKNFGKSIKEAYSFPSCKSISLLSIEDLSCIKAGFRSKYIMDAARRISNFEVEFMKLKLIKTEDAIKILQKIKGVGPKVASCTLLYGFHKFDCFPVDTWIRKVLDKSFSECDYKKIGKYMGLAQLYLFNWSRSHPEYF